MWILYLGRETCVRGLGFRGGGGVESEGVGVDLEAEFEGDGEEGGTLLLVAVRAREMVGG